MKMKKQMILISTIINLDNFAEDVQDDIEVIEAVEANPSGVELCPQLIPSQCIKSESLSVGPNPATASASDADGDPPIQFDQDPPQPFIDQNGVITLASAFDNVVVTPQLQR